MNLPLIVTVLMLTIYSTQFCVNEHEIGSYFEFKDEGTGLVDCTQYLMYPFFHIMVTKSVLYNR